MKEKDIFRMFFLFTILTFFGLNTLAQVAINTDGSAPDSSAILDLKSSNKGLLPPRLTDAEMNAISTPVAGLVVYNTTTNSVFCYDGTIWRKLFRNNGESCGTIDYGGQIYQTVIIGSQCWMAENLNIGSFIPRVQDQTDNDTIEKYCYTAGACVVYGGLYQWDEMMQYVTTEGTQGICPPGWHLPSDAEWCILENEMDTGSVSCSSTGYRGTDAGKRLKATTRWLQNTGTDVFGFAALPGGYRFTDGGFYGVGYDGFWWSSTEYDSDYSWYRSMNGGNDKVNRNGSDNENGFSVRCLKDDFHP